MKRLVSGKNRSKPFVRARKEKHEEKLEVAKLRENLVHEEFIVDVDSVYDFRFVAYFSNPPKMHFLRPPHPTPAVAMRNGCSALSMLKVLPTEAAAAVVVPAATLRACRVASCPARKGKRRRGLRCVLCTR